MKVECKGNQFKGLKNPYTGEDVKTYMVVVKGKPMYFAPDTYSTYDNQKDAKTAFSMWSRVDGVIGLRNAENGILCAYTGKPLTIVRAEGGWYYAGGFDPGVLHDYYDYLGHMRMRNGEPPFKERKPVEPVNETAPVFTKTHEAPIVEGSIEAAEKTLKDSGFKTEKKTAVSVGKKGK